MPNRAVHLITAVGSVPLSRRVRYSGARARDAKGDRFVHSQPRPTELLFAGSLGMSEPIAFLNGQLVPVSEASLHVFDLGVVGGLALSEMLRTFAHHPFRISEHLARLRAGLELVGWPLAQSLDELGKALEQVVQHNVRLISPHDDLGVIVFVTAGLNPTYVGHGHAAATATVGIHTFVLPFENWAVKYDVGQHLVIPTSFTLPLAAAVPPTLKTRSRMHWHLADRAAKHIDPAAMALLIDETGGLTETGTGNLCVVRDGVVISPPEGTVLEGVSLGMVADICAAHQLPFLRERVTRDDLLTASEAFLTSTPTGLLPVTVVDHQPIGTGEPGPVTRRLLAAWSKAVGVDLRQQMRRELT